jgi:Helix-turn-helix of DDE superfamily endonuclease
MLYEEVSSLKDEEFGRLTGVTPSVFEKMLGVLQASEALLKKRGGRPSRLGVENRLMVALMYWREYRTYFHIAKSYNISESLCFRYVKWAEDTLIKNGSFRLPGKKSLLNPNEEGEVVMIDATECAIERPKKNSAVSTLGRKSVTHKKPKL